MAVPLDSLSSGWQKAFWTLIGFTFVIYSTLGTWVIWETHELRVRVAAIEASRFTYADGLEMRKTLNGKADKADVPPAWFRAEVLSMKNDLRDQRKEFVGQLKSIEQRLRNIEIRLGNR